MRGVVHSVYDRMAALLAGISLIYVVIHTALLSVHELFRGGARIGNALYEVFLAYFVSYILYLIVVALPRERDRCTSRPIIREAVSHIIGDESVVRGVLQQPTNTDIEAAAEPDFYDLCKKKNPADGPERAYITETGTVVVQHITV